MDAVLDDVAAHAAALDRGDEDGRPALRALAGLDLLVLGAGPDRVAELPDVVALVEELASRCLATAFSVWAHRMVIDYLAHAPGRVDSEPLRHADRFGSTGLAPALRDVAGLGEVPLVARRDGAGVRVSGPVRWASNLFPGTLLTVPVRLPDEGPAARAVVVVDVDDPGVEIAPFPRLLALDATASSSLTLLDAPATVLTEDLGSFVGACRPRLMLIQSAFCLGLARRSLEEARGGLTGLAASLSPAVERVADTLDDARGRLHRSAADPASVAPREHAALRLDAALVAGEATRAEAAVVGGAGYEADSPTARRLREAAFLPVQAPTEALLRTLVAPRRSVERDRPEHTSRS